MFLLSVKKKFIKELTVIGVVLTTLVAVVYHLFIPDRYFLWFPAIPIFFYLFGLLYIEMFAFNYRVGLERIAMTYLVCKVLKFIVSAMLLMFYGFVIGHEVVAFMLFFFFFFFVFLFFFFCFFFFIEEKLKLRKKANDEKITVHNHHAVTADGGSGCADEGTGR